MDGICIDSGGNTVSACEWQIDIHLTMNRIDVQDRVRRLGANPEEDDQRLVEKKRQMLSAMMIRLKELQDLAKITTKLGTVNQTNDEDEGQFDDTVHSPDNPNAGGQETGQDPSAVERHILTLPSNGNVSEDVSAIEIRDRVKQVRRQITRLRDLIADISFQYSHVVRNAPRKSYRTAAQKRVRALHNDLSYNARIYTQCRSRLIVLNCEESVLRMFRVLTKQDLKASTEILRPNEQGSSSVKLSWIWRTGRYFLFQPNVGNEAGGSTEAGALGTGAGLAGPLPEADATNDNNETNDTNADPATLLECTSMTLGNSCQLC